MNIDGSPWRTIWLEDDRRSIGVIDQTLLPHRFETRKLVECDDAALAISTMVVRGAPLIGVTGAYGLMLAMQKDPSDESLNNAFEKLNATRPTAVNLRWALQRVRDHILQFPCDQRAEEALLEAKRIENEDILMCSSIGDHGLGLIKKLISSRPLQQRGKPFNILTHCNAGWLAAVDWGTALAPIYKAHRAGIDIHVWVDETRPRNQGASLTAYELNKEGISHTVIVDNAGGHLMQHGLVDAVFVGSDRTTKTGDVCNKIGTYLKALAAHDNGVPFYVALPSSTIDWTIQDGLSQIPIETRSSVEVTHIQGRDKTGRLSQLKLTPDGSEALNSAFDVTPARLVSALITENGVSAPSEEGLQSLFKKV